MNKILAGALALLVVLPAAAAKKFDPDARARAVAPFLDEQTVGVVHVDLTGIDVDALAARGYLIELAGLEPKGIERPKRELRHWLAALIKAGGRDLYVVCSLADLPNQPPFVVAPVPAGADAQVLRREMEHNKLFRGLRFDTLTHFIPVLGDPDKGGLGHFDQAVVGGGESTLKRLRTLQPTPRPELVQAFAAAGDTTAQVLVLPTADMRRILEELLPTLPPEVGTTPITTFTRGFQWAALGVDAPPKGALRLVIQSPDPVAAQALRVLLVRIRSAVRQTVVRQARPEFDKVAALLTPKVAGDRLILSLEDQPFTAAVQPLLVRQRAAAARARSGNNLHQIVLAMHNYHDTHKAFPAVANFDRQGKSLLSWRVHLLPYLGQQALYKEFHLDEPWDSEHNRKLIARMPAVHRSPLCRMTRAGTTTYLAPVGAQTMFTGGPKGVTIADVTDGTSNTIFLVEADDDHAVIWTKPDDLKHDPNQPAAGLRNYEGMLLAAFVDVSVHQLPATIDAKALQALFTRNGGEVVPVP
jgi:hypothetical protein